MVVRQKLTPEAFLGAPRRSPAVPAPSGRLAFFVVSKHTFNDGGRDKGSTCSQLVLLDLKTSEQWPLSTSTDCEDTEGEREDASRTHDCCWMPTPSAEASSRPDELVWLRPAKDDPGATEVVVAEATAAAGYASSLPQPPPPYVAAVVPAPIKALRLRALPDGTVLFAAAGLIGSDGTLHSNETGMGNHTVSGSTARIYDTWQMRECDAFVEAQRYGIWYSTLVRRGKVSPLLSSSSSSSSISDMGAGRWSLSGPLHNALGRAQANLEAPSTIHDSDEDATDAFDIGPQGIVFSGRDRHPADPMTNDCTNVYYVPLDSFTEEAIFPPVRITLVLSEPLFPSPLQPRSPAGFVKNVRFSPNGSRFAFLWAPLDCPADRRLHMGHVSSGAAVDVATVVNGGGRNAAWSIEPSSFAFVPSGEAVVITAYECGRRTLSVLELQPGARPRPLSFVQHGSVSAVHLLSRGPDNSDPLAVSLLVSGSSFVESSFYYLVDAVSSEDSMLTIGPHIVVSSQDEARHGLSHEVQVSEMYFEGADDGYCVHAWVVRPSTFDPSQRYPLALLVHGGPEAAWEDKWQPSWNAAVWAEQGYVVVLPNVTGSVGFGLEHAERIYGNWGRYPYQDLDQCMASLEDVPYIDMGRAIVAGAGYGGYMVNWINGGPLARQFCAAVSENGIFSTETMALNADMSGGMAHFRGSGFAWENAVGLQQWNPARPERLRSWRTSAPPTLVVHGDGDCRMALTDGLAAFRVLQFQGVPSRFLSFSDEGLMALAADNALAWHRVVFAWLRRWISDEGRAQDRARRQLTAAADDDRLF